VHMREVDWRCPLIFFSRVVEYALSNSGLADRASRLGSLQCDLTYMTLGSLNVSCHSIRLNLLQISQVVSIFTIEADACGNGASLVNTSQVRFL